MDEMKETYVQEANELLENLESSLLSLEDNPNDKSNIEQVFRVMHTLKGNSSMFGLTKIAEFVHDLETIYDKIRQNEMQLSKEILNTTLASFDHLNKIIYDSELEDQNNKDNHFRLIAEIHVFIGKSDSIGKVNSDSGAEVAVQRLNDDKSSDDDSNSLKTFHIYFEPNPSVFLDGSNPLFLVAELAAMGKSIVVPHFKTVTNLDEYSPTECITFWDVYLESTCLKTDVLDVFVFVEGNSTIEIMEMPFINLISNNVFNEVVIASTFKDLKTDTTSIRLLAESIGTKVESTSKQSKLSKALAAEAEAGSGVVSKEKVVSSIRVASDKLDELMNLVSELVTTQASLTLYNEKNETPELEVITENIEKLSRRLRDIAFGMTLVPINNMFSRFQRLVRDMSETLGKEIQFVTEGGETELDKSIIETLTDPLMHIIRNSLDHGLEKAEDRMLLDKPRKGTVKLKAFYSGISVYVQIIDDGKGIDVEAVRAKAISKGFITEGDILTDKEIFDYIFYPGFSTAAVVTDISGRGVGMDVVKRNITDLKGAIVVESTVNIGTTLTIKLPLSLSIIDGLLVDIEGVNYIIPLSVVNKCYEVDNSEMLNNFNKLLVLDEKQVPFIDIRNEFGYKKLDSTAKSQLIVVSDGDQQVGITVDYIVGEYQAVVKPIGKYYKNQDFISGATILGDGSIALVMDTHKIVELYTDHFKLESK